jgi:hypothetical protein
MARKTNKTTLLPSKRAKSEILSAAKSLGVHMTYAAVTQMTGYAPSVVRDALKSYRKPLPNGRPPVAAITKPKFIEEIEKTTGLKGLRISVKILVEEWWLLSPSQFPVAVVLGYGSIAQSVRLLPNAICMFQGITKDELAQRRKTRIQEAEKRKQESTKQKE